MKECLPPKSESPTFLQSGCILPFARSTPSYLYLLSIPSGLLKPDIRKFYVNIAEKCLSLYGRSLYRYHGLGDENKFARGYAFLSKPLHPIEQQGKLWELATTSNVYGFIYILWQAYGSSWCMDYRMESAPKTTTFSFNCQSFFSPSFFFLFFFFTFFFPKENMFL